MVRNLRLCVAATVVIAVALGISLPAGAQIRFGGEGIWQCSRCKREMGRGPAPPAQCPHCGALIVNNPGNARVASMTGIVVALIVTLIVLAILAVALVIVLKKGKIGLMQSRVTEESDLPIVRGGKKKSEVERRPPTYEL